MGWGKFIGTAGLFGAYFAEIKIGSSKSLKKHLEYYRTQDLVYLD